MENDEVLAKIKVFSQDNFQMTLATYSKHPWIATVYYAVDNHLHFYFLSDPQTLHCQAIAQNPEVALAIAQSPQTPASDKKGLQIFGLAKQLSYKDVIIHFLALWKQILNVTSDTYSYEGMMRKAIKGRIYQVIPQKVKFFNEELWAEGSEPLIDVT